MGNVREPLSIFFYMCAPVVSGVLQREFQAGLPACNYCIHISDNGLIYLSDADYGFVNVFKLDGNFVRKMELPGIRYIRSISSDPSSSTLFVADSLRVKEFSSDGSFVKNFGASYCEVSALEYDPNDQILFIGDLQKIEARAFKTGELIHSFPPGRGALNGLETMHFDRISRLLHVYHGFDRITTFKTDGTEVSSFELPFTRPSHRVSSFCSYAGLLFLIGVTGVWVVDSAGQVVHRWGNSAPRGIAEHDGLIYTTDTSSNWVRVFI